MFLKPSFLYKHLVYLPLRAAWNCQWVMMTWLVKCCPADANPASSHTDAQWHHITVATQHRTNGTFLWNQVFHWTFGLEILCFSRLSCAFQLCLCCVAFSRVDISKHFKTYEAEKGNFCGLGHALNVPKCLQCLELSHSRRDPTPSAIIYFSSKMCISRKHSDLCYGAVQMMS